MKLGEKLFFLPGNLIADLIGAKKADDRMMVRMLIGMLFWNVVVITGAWIIFR